MKKTITFLLAMLFAVASASSQSSGTCGDNATWDYNDGVLTISGTGTMTDFMYISKPWLSLQNAITEVKVDEGITNIGSYAFHSFSELIKVTLPSTLKILSNYSFYGCTKLSSVTFSAESPAALEKIEKFAFYRCESLSSVNWNVLSNLMLIDEFSFSYCN